MSLKNNINSNIRRFTIQSVTKYVYKNNKNLSEFLTLFPCYGMGFKLFKKNNTNDYYVIDRVFPKNNRNSTIYAVYHKQGVPNKKEQRLNSDLNHNIWNYEPFNIVMTDNKLEYDIKKYEDLIGIKKKMIMKRNKLMFQNDKTEDKI
jgi:hypothetical protein